MRPILLDCTLRDGGNQNDWMFSRSDVRNIVSSLDQARVDVIEVGYLGGSGSKRGGNYGESADCPQGYLSSLPAVSNAELAVMVVPTACPLERLDQLPGGPVGLVRVASYPWNLDMVPNYVERIRELGLRAGVNIMAVSYVSVDELRKLARRIAQLPVDMVYIADSFGGLDPDDIWDRVTVLVDELDVAVGIHAHNNLGMAVANMLAAVDAGATCVDASLAAMARGAGNVATEQAAAVFTKMAKFDSPVDLSQVCEAAELVNRDMLAEPMTVGRDEIEAGINDHHYYFLSHIKEFSEVNGLDFWEVGAATGRARPERVTPETVAAAWAKH